MGNFLEPLNKPCVVRGRGVITCQGGGWKSDPIRTGDEATMLPLLIASTLIGTLQEFSHSDRNTAVLTTNGSGSCRFFGTWFRLLTSMARAHKTLSVEFVVLPQADSRESQQLHQRGQLCPVTVPKQIHFVLLSHPWQT